MTVFEHDGRLLVVDCGVLFPEDDQPGVDLILPDFRPIEDRLDDIDAVVLTHGHEDHIGAVPFLLRQRPDLPVVGSRFTLALVAEKCREHRLTPHLLEVAEGARLRHGPWDCEFFAVNHSIPDALAVAIRTSAGLVLHTGDIKLDQLPLDGRLTDLAGFSRLGDEGVDLFLVDSTNAEVPGFVTAEREIGPVIESVFHRSPARIIVACFASHVHRVQQVLDAAAEHGRQGVPRRPVDGAQHGHRRGAGLPRRARTACSVDLDDAMALPDRRAGARLDRVAGRAALGAVPDGPRRPPVGADPARGHDHPGQLADPGQRDRRLRRHQRADPARRHGRAPGQREGARLRPRPGRRAAVPLQRGAAEQRDAGARGVAAHPRERRARRRAPGVPEDCVVLAEDGVVVDLVDGRAAITGRVEVGRVYVDGLSVGDIGESTLSATGWCSARAGSCRSPWPSTRRRGARCPGRRSPMRGFSDDPKALDAVLPLVEMELSRTEAEGITDTHRIAQAVRRVVGRWVGETYRRRPMIVPTVIPV